MQSLQTAEIKQTEAAVPQDRPPVVLLVDDDPTTLHMLSGMLQQEGIATLNADTVEKARSVAADEPFDLAVLDVNLPDGNGLDLCRWVRQHPSCAGVPVLMLSAEQDVRTKVAGFDAGAVDYITKPFHRAEVMARVRTQLRLNAAHRAVIELQAVKLAQLARYFTLENGFWKVRDELRALATFRTMNLLEPMAFPVNHDIIFCRNVAIYFTEQDRARLFSAMANVLAPDGCLIIGSTESLTGLCPQYEARRYLRSVFYQFKGEAERFKHAA